MSNISSVEERNQIKDKLKYGYSKKVMSVNLLLDKNIDQLVDMNFKLSNSFTKRNDNMQDLKKFLDWLIQ